VISPVTAGAMLDVFLMADVMEISQPDGLDQKSERKVALAVQGDGYFRYHFFGTIALIVIGNMSKT
jgi:hypothetical protein